MAGFTTVGGERGAVGCSAARLNAPILHCTMAPESATKSKTSAKITSVAAPSARLADN